MPSHRTAPRLPARRRLLQGLSGACALAWCGASQSAASDAGSCASGTTSQPLPQPGASGYLGRVAVGDAPLQLRAGAVGPLPANVTHGPLGFAAARGTARYVNPTLLAHRGERVRIALDNALDRATIVHWHGLSLDTRNDGGGMPLIAPGERYEYAFEVRNRAGLYWYHPHPHGDTAGQVHDGLYGLFEVEDDESLALRRALDLAPGATELTIVLQDRSPGVKYVATPAERIHGRYGDTLYANGVACAHADVGTRVYRLRLVNACNARTLLIGLRTAAGTPVPYDVIGNDGGLLAAPVRCQATFLAAAERLDLLVDLRDAAIGDALVLESRSFDPMHAEVALPSASAAESPTASASAAHHHPAQGEADPHAGHAAAAWPEGAPRDILTLRVRSRLAYDRRVPAQLSKLTPIDATGAVERPLRLGYKSGQWRINDRVFAMGEAPIEVVRGTTETWLLRNYHTSMPHAMHLHGFAFDVLERETPPEQVHALAVDARGRLASELGRKDTVLVWPGESVRVAIRFDMPFPGPQTYMFHCHNLEHEDGGMMLGVKVA